MAMHYDDFIALPGWFVIFALIVPKMQKILYEIAAVQNDGNHSIDEKSITIKKLEVFEIKESYLLPSRRGGRKWLKASETGAQVEAK
nr:hypothetical protein [Tanacetum cinerariifolium]